MAKYITITRKKDRLREKLNAMVPGVNEAINEANEKSAKELYEAIYRAAPDVTGDYKEHLDYHPVADGGITGTTRVRGILGNSVRKSYKATNILAWGIYAIFWWKSLEFGRQGTRARPHILPTYRSYRKRIKSRNSRAINKRIKEVVK